jgi:hypothetical protein
MRVELEPGRALEPPVTARALDKFQKSHNLALPLLLRDFLLRHNGGLLLGSHVSLNALADIHVLDADEILMLGLPQPRKLRGKLVRFAWQVDGHVSYLLNYADVKSTGEPSVYSFDIECGPAERSHDGFEAFIRDVLAADDEPEVTLDHAKECGRIVYDYTKSHGPDWVERQLVCVVGVRTGKYKAGVYLFEHSRTASTFEYSRYFLATPLDHEAATIVTDEMGSQLHLEVRRSTGVQCIRSSRRADGKWKTDRDGGLAYVSIHCDDTAMLRSLRTLLFGNDVSALHEQMESLEAEHELFLTSLTSAQRDEALVRTAIGMLEEVTGPLERELETLSMAKALPGKRSGGRQTSGRRSKPASRSAVKKVDPVVEEAVRRSEEVESRLDQLRTAIHKMKLKR